MLLLLQLHTHDIPVLFDIEYILHNLLYPLDLASPNRNRLPDLQLRSYLLLCFLRRFLSLFGLTKAKPLSMLQFRCFGYGRLLILLVLTKTDAYWVGFVGEVYVVGTVFDVWSG